MPHLESKVTDEIQNTNLQDGTLEKSKLLEREASKITGIKPTLGSTITSDDLADIAVPNIKQPRDIPPPSISALADLRKNEKPPETPLESQLSEFESLASLDFSPAQKERKVRVQTQAEQRRLNELNKQAALLEARALEAEQKARETGETLGFKGREAQRVRNQFAVEALRLNAQIQAAQGNLSLARQLAQESVEAKFVQEKEDIRVKRANIISIFDQLTPEQKKRAENALLRLDSQDEFIKEQEQKEKAKEKVLLEYAGLVENDVLEEARQAEDAISAKQILEQNVARERDTKITEINGRNVLIDTQTGEIIKDLSSTLIKDGIDIGVPEADFGSPEYRYNVIASSVKFGDKSMTQGQLEKVQQALTALGGIESLNSLLFGGDIKNSTGFVRGNVRKLINLFGADAPASQINAIIQGLVPTVARGIFGEVGVLTDTDIKNYSKTMANLTSSEEQNRLVSIVMLDVLSRSIENTLTTNALNQINVSNFAPVILNVRRRIDTEKLKLGITPYTGLKNDEFLDSVPEEKEQIDSSEGFKEQIQNFLNFYFK